MALRGVQDALHVQSTASATVASAKLIDTLFKARIGAFSVHSHRLEAPIDVHAVALQEELQLAGGSELVDAAKVALLLELDVLKVLHL